jgi:hypothetical protein
MTYERFVVMTVQCGQRKTKAAVHVAAKPGVYPGGQPIHFVHCFQEGI